MTDEEIRQKAIESARAISQNCGYPCRECDYGDYFLTADFSCFAVSGYEHGFADGVAEGKKAATIWIPVTEKLPEDRREVFVTAYWHETYQVMIGTYFGDGLWWCAPFNNCGEHLQKLNPIAWMPLPKPFKGGEEA